MGWKQRDAQAMVDRAKPHVGRETSASEAMRLALREGALPRSTCVREELATYSATHAGRGELRRASSLIGRRVRARES